MKILFGKHYGKEVSELDSSYLIWVIENYENADWSLKNSCKEELAKRLKLKTITEIETIPIIFTKIQTENGELINPPLDKTKTGQIYRDRFQDREALRRRHIADFELEQIMKELNALVAPE